MLTRSPSLLKAISRLRSWERCSAAVTVIAPATRRRPRRASSSIRWSSDSATESTMFQVSSTRLSEVLTCWPPGPDERENRQPSSAAGIVRAGDTSRSMHQASHDPVTTEPFIAGYRSHRPGSTPQVQFAANALVVTHPQRDFLMDAGFSVHVAAHQNASRVTRAPRSVRCTAHQRLATAGCDFGRLHGVLLRYESNPRLPIRTIMWPA